MAELTDIRESVRARYAAAVKAASASAEASCCGPESLSCSPADADGVFGGSLYDVLAGEELPLAAVNASLGCGVPTAVADLAEGETVLDLGSGAGADVLISARRVGPTGKAIGLDMTDEMLELARAKAAAAGVQNVEFLKGYLEEMPLANESVDVVISNCVINLSGDKPTVIREAARVLRAGGRFAVSDVIADPDMGQQTKADMAAWTGCIAGALTETEFREMLQSAGFDEIEIRETHRVHEHASAAIIRARKPTVAGCCEPDAQASCCESEHKPEAALTAARHKHERVEPADFTEALSRIILGSERRITLSPAERERTAYHEAGHAVLGMVEPGADPVRKVSIVPRGRALGVTFQSPDVERYGYDVAYLHGRITGALGGRAAEELVYGDITTGAESDLEQVTRIARQMVGRWGMSDVIGPVSILPAPGEEQVVLPGSADALSEATRNLVESETRRIVDECYARALEKLRENRARLDRLAAALLEHETLDELDAYRVAGLERPQDGATRELPAGRSGGTVEPDQTATARPASA